MRRLLFLLAFLWTVLPAAAQLRVGVVDKCPLAGGTGTDAGYVLALQRGGNAVLILPYTEDAGLLAEAVSALDLVFLTGGEDIDPAYFGEAPSKALGTVNARRDTLEFRVIAEAMKQGKPIVGTCRGLQVLNVYFGGSLWQDLPSQYEKALNHRAPAGHPILLSKGTRLHSLLRADSLWVNSTHHQAIKDLAPGFRVSAVCPDGVIEAFESDKWPIAAFQFHPERLAVGQDTVFVNIFRHLRELAGK